MRRHVRFFLLFSFAAALVFAADKVRNWQTGMLVETEKQQVKQGSMTTSNADYDMKKKGDKTELSGNSTSRTTDDYDTFQVYTIKAGGTTYVAREKLLFPWSKPASVTVGAELKYAVERNTLYLLGDDGKQHKASISRASVSGAQ